MNEEDKYKKFWKKHHLWEDAVPLKKKIRAGDALYGEWYWFPKEKQWGKRCEGSDERDGRALFFGPNGFATRTSYDVWIHPMKKVAC